MAQTFLSLALLPDNGGQTTLMVLGFSMLYALLRPKEFEAFAERVRERLCGARRAAAVVDQ